MWMERISCAVAARGRAAGLAPWPSPYFSSQSSSRSCTVGTSAKLYTGGGDGMDHSRVRPSQGSGPAGVPDRKVFTTLTMKIANDSAMIRAPIVDTRFQKLKY